MSAPSILRRLCVLQMTTRKHSLKVRRLALQSQLPVLRDQHCLKIGPASPSALLVSQVALPGAGLRGCRLQIMKDLHIPTGDGKCVPPPGDTLFVQNPGRKAHTFLGALLFVLLFYLLLFLCVFMICVCEYRTSYPGLVEAKG